MKNYWYRVVLSFLYIVGALYIAPTAYGEASKNSAEANPIGFTYQVIHPENQRKNVGYFDLRMKPNQEQTVQVELRNTTKEEKTIEVSINGTTTNSNGVIENGPSDIEKDASEIYAFEDLVSGPNTVKLKAMGTTLLELKIKMPEDSYDGVISGGIQLKEQVNIKKRSSQVGVINEYAFLIGMLLTETDTKVVPELALNEVYVGTSSGQGVIFANISNTQAAFLGDLTLEVQVTQAGKAAVLYETKKGNLQMGPNNQMDFPVSLNGSNLVAGEYEAHVSAVAGDQSWSWDQPFTVTDEEAKKSSQQQLSDSGDKGINWLFVVGLLTGLVCIALGVFFVIRKMNRGKQATGAQRKGPQKQGSTKAKSSNAKNRKGSSK